MKAVVLEEQGVINVREVPDVPAPGLGELKIAPHTVGVCGSDRQSGGVNMWWSSR